MLVAVALACFAHIGTTSTLGTSLPSRRRSEAVRHGVDRQQSDSETDWSGSLDLIRGQFEWLRRLEARPRRIQQGTGARRKTEARRAYPRACQRAWGSLLRSTAGIQLPAATAN